MAEARPDFGYMADVVNEYGRNLPPTAGIIEDIACGGLSNAWTDVVTIDEGLAAVQADCSAEMENW